VRQFGLFGAVDFCPEVVKVQDVIDKLFRDKNVIAIACGKNSLRTAPPLVITEKQIETFAQKLFEVVVELVFFEKNNTQSVDLLIKNSASLKVKHTYSAAAALGDDNLIESLQHLELRSLGSNADKNVPPKVFVSSNVRNEKTASTSAAVDNASSSTAEAVAVGDSPPLEEDNSQQPKKSQYRGIYCTY